MAKLSPGRGRLPSLPNLLNKSPGQLMFTLQRFNMEPDISEVNRAADRALARVDKLLETGHPPDEHTLDLVRQTIVREAKGVIRKQVKGAIRNYKMGKLEEAGFTKFIWIAVVLGSCPSCIKRHGQIKTMAQWEKVGMPGSFALLCNGDCRCHLAPEAAY